MRLLPAAILACLWLAPQAGQAQDKIKYGSAIKLSPTYYLPVLAAQSEGIFKRHDLDVEWVPAQSGPDFQRDIAAGAIQMGSSNGGTDIPAITRGAPAVIVATLRPNDDFAIWVETDSRFHQPEDLKGAKLAVSRLNGVEHSYGRLVVNRLNLNKDVQFVAAGGTVEGVALLVTHHVDGVVLSPNEMINLELQHKVRRFIEISDYKAKPWLAYTITASKDFLAQKPELARRVVEAILEANRFILTPAGRTWAIAKMKEMNNYSEEGAEAIYSNLDLSPDGRIDTSAVKNVVDFMVNYHLLKPGDVRSIDALFSDRLVR